MLCVQMRAETRHPHYVHRTIVVSSLEHKMFFYISFGA